MKHRFASSNVAGIWLALAIPCSAFAQSAEPWWPVNGTVMLSGGGLEDAIADSLVDRLIALAGGPDALIVIIPTAHDGLPARLTSSAPEPTHIKNIREYVGSRGARNVVFLHTRDRQVDPMVDRRKPYVRLSGGQHSNLTRVTTPNEH